MYVLTGCNFSQTAVDGPLLLTSCWAAAAAAAASSLGGYRRRLRFLWLRLPSKFKKPVQLKKVLCFFLYWKHWLFGLLETNKRFKTHTHNLHLHLYWGFWDTHGEKINQIINVNNVNKWGKDMQSEATPLKKPVKVLVGNQEIPQEVEMFQY